MIEELGKIRGSGAISFYPLSTRIARIDVWYLFYQQFHRRQMLNGAKPNTEASLYTDALIDLFSPYTPKMLKGLGIGKVVVLSDFFEKSMPGKLPFRASKMPDGYELIKKTKDGYIYEVTDRSAKISPLYLRGFTRPILLEDYAALTIMLKTPASMLLVNKNERAIVDLEIQIICLADEGKLKVAINGEPIGTLNIKRGRATLRFPA